MAWYWQTLISIAAALLLAWLVLVVALLILTAVLRSVVRRAGLETVRRHWPGTDDGFAVLSRLAGLNR